MGMGRTREENKKNWCMRSKWEVRKWIKRNDNSSHLLLLPPFPPPLPSLSLVPPHTECLYSIPLTLPLISFPNLSHSFLSQPIFTVHLLKFHILILTFSLFGIFFKSSTRFTNTFCSAFSVWRCWIK